MTKPRLQARALQVVFFASIVLTASLASKSRIEGPGAIPTKRCHVRVTAWRRRFSIPHQQDVDPTRITAA